MDAETHHGRRGLARPNEVSPTAPKVACRKRRSHTHDECSAPPPNHESRAPGHRNQARHAVVGRSAIRCPPPTPVRPRRSHGDAPAQRDRHGRMGSSLPSRPMASELLRTCQSHVWWTSVADRTRHEGAVFAAGNRRHRPLLRRTWRSYKLSATVRECELRRSAV